MLIIGPNRGMSEGHELVTMGHVDMSTLGAWSIWHNGIKKVWGCYLKTQSCDTPKIEHSLVCAGGGGTS